MNNSAHRQNACMSDFRSGTHLGSPFEVHDLDAVRVRFGLLRFPCDPLHPAQTVAACPMRLPQASYGSEVDVELEVKRAYTHLQGTGTAIGEAVCDCPPLPTT